MSPNVFITHKYLILSTLSVCCGLQVRQQALERRQAWRQRLEQEQAARTDQLAKEWLNGRTETNPA